MKNHISHHDRLVGIIAIAILANVLWRNVSVLPVFFAAIFLILICSTDALTGRIPNIFTLIFACSGVAINIVSGGGNGLLSSLLGLVCGFLILLVPYHMGGMGAGDVKALAALGAILGMPAILHVALYMALVGGLMSLSHYLFKNNIILKFREMMSAIVAFIYNRNFKTLIPHKKRHSERLPYAAAIAYGFIAYNFWGSLI